MLWHRLACWVAGHKYLPAHEWWFAGSPNKPKNQKFRYQCECCKQKTRIMNSKQHEYFLITACPTWGARGSDSQGYRSKQD